MTTHDPKFDVVVYQPTWRDRLASDAAVGAFVGLVMVLAFIGILTVLMTIIDIVTG